ncbi:MAG: 50S ribosomal protein L18 [Planctomycetota bacterium]|nr:50S ribosomal protein L18 [Planctomycetota bacterium]
MTAIKMKRAALARRHLRSRRTLEGTPERPRLSVYRSLKHIYAQIIDDVSGKTLLSLSSLSKDVKGDLKSTGNIKAAAKVGTLLAAKATESGIKAVCFDRGGRKYHGRVKALAEAARKGGLKF